MPISFTCEKCSKKVKAPDETGGNYGACPHCKHKCYIPLPLKEGEEELTLAPLEEDNYAEMMKQTHSLTENILHETALPDDAIDENKDGFVSDKEIIKGIIMYVRQMVDSNLDQAKETTASLHRHSLTAKDIIKRMLKAGAAEPELADIPPKLLNQMLKQLYSQMQK